MNRRRSVIQAARFSPDGERLITGSLAGKLVEWDVESGQRLRVLLDPDEDDHPELQFFDEHGERIETDFRLERLSEDMRGSSVMSIAYFPDGSRFVVTAGNGIAVAWNARGGEIQTWRAHDTAAVVVEVSQDGRWLATGCVETGATTLRVWRVAESWGRAPAEAFSSDRMIGGVYSLSFSPDSRFLATGGWGYSGYSSPMIYDVESGKRVRILPFDASRAIRHSPDGKLLATGDEFGKVSIWDVETGARIVEREKAHGRIVSVVEFSPDGRLLVSGSCDGGLKIWDVASGGLREEHVFRGMILCCRFSADGGSLSVAAGPEGEDQPGIHHLAVAGNATPSR